MEPVTYSGGGGGGGGGGGVAAVATEEKGCSLEGAVANGGGNAVGGGVGAREEQQATKYAIAAIGYKIGERVEVMWGGVPYNAKVTHKYDNGSMDVVYDNYVEDGREMQGSKGIFLTIKEHGLKKILPQEKKGS